MGWVPRESRICELSYRSHRSRSQEGGRKLRVQEQHQPSGRAMVLCLGRSSLTSLQPSPHQQTLIEHLLCAEPGQLLRGSRHCL